jgi:signal transduction histidine kinase
MLRRRTALLFALALALLVTFALAFGVDDALELPLRDAMLARLPARPATATAIVAIDEESLRELGPWPWSRATLAKLVDRIADAGARGVVLDVLLADAREGDAQLAASLHRLPAVLVSVLDERGEWLVPPPLLRDAATAAHGNFEVDHDGILRRLASTKQSRERSLTALSVEAATIVTQAPVPVGRSLAPMFRTRPRAIPVVRAAALLRSPAAGSALRGRLVFVGPTAQALGDRVLTPVSEGSVQNPDVEVPDPGVTVHAAATESLVRGEVIRELPPIAAGLLAGLGAALVLTRRSRPVRIAFAAALGAATVIAGIVLLERTGVALPAGSLVLAIVLPALAVEARLMLDAQRRGDVAAGRLEQNLGLAAAAEPGEVGPRLEEIAVHLAERRQVEAESKRLLAHELRTPLASMRGLSQLLGGFELSDVERRRVASLLESEAGKLQIMVQALLDLERLPLRDFAASTAVVDLGDLVGTRVAFLRASTDRIIGMTLTPGIVVRADPALLERAVDNLVGNALKYSPAGAPVAVSVVREGAQAVLAVEDGGPGIAPAERERIFERFFRGTTAESTNGLGLGLSLVAEIVRWHGGTIRLEAPASGGSRFRITLPPSAVRAEAG